MPPPKFLLYYLRLEPHMYTGHRFAKYAGLSISIGV